MASMLGKAKRASVAVMGALNKGLSVARATKLDAFDQHHLR